jgi:hypothetical protein
MISRMQKLAAKGSEINAEQKQQLSADQRRRNEAEGVFGSGKRKNTLKLIITRLTNGAETSISMAFLVMCAEKILRLLRLFLTLFLPGSTACSGFVYQGR